jgi:hypothetical protein
MAKQTFTVGQVLTADQMTSLQQTAMGGGSATAKTASHTLVAADAGTTVIMNSASATTITVNTSLFAAGDTVLIVNQGAGVCTITAGTATVSTAGSLALSQYETGQLYFLSTSAAIFTEYTQAASAGGGMTLLTTTTLSGTSTTSASFATTYKELVCHFYGLNTSASNEIRLRVNSNTGNNYGMSYFSDANTSFTQDNATSSLRLVDYFATVPGYAVGKISIPEYANTSLTSKSCFVTQSNTSARRMISTGYITETTAISTLTFFSTSTISGTVLIYGVN